MNITSCDLCEGVQYSAIAENDRHGQPLSTVICETCGLVRHAVIPSEEELQQFYSTNYREAYNGERTPGSRRIMRAWNNGLRIAAQISPLLKKHGRVLEVGAGIGCTVKVFEKAGFDSEGIDPGSEFLEISKEKLNANVRVGDLYEIPQGHSFDAVLLVHVIEHFRSPKRALTQIAGLLKPGGMFYVECPNLQAPFARRSQLFHTAHIHNFVPSTLQMMAEVCGFRLRQRFGDEFDVNLQMLFEYTGECQLQIDRENPSRTIDQLDRSNTLQYLARGWYVADRVQKLASYASEYWQAKPFVQALIRDCQLQADTCSVKVNGKAA